MKKFLHKIHYSKQCNFLQKMVKIGLFLPSFCYFFVVELRNFFYKIGLLRKVKLDATVISVGNLTTGGTGKTPFTAELAKVCMRLQKRVAIVSRGYGGSLPLEEISVISNGDEVFYGAKEAGDEPFWLANEAKGVIVITSKNRVEASRLAIKEFGADVIILDDGYQHQKLDRDLNLLLVDGQNKFGNEDILPLGPLREPIRQVNRADKIVLVNKYPYNEQSVKDCRAYARFLIKNYDKEVFSCHIVTGGFVHYKYNRAVLEPQNVYAFTGVAQPESFFDCIRAFGHDILVGEVFDDHHSYSLKDIENISQNFKSSGAQCILTTQKDFVKIEPLLQNLNEDLPLYVSFQTVEVEFSSLIEKVISY